MFKSIFSNPKRVLVCLLLLVSYGLYSGFTLPISMYPATSRPNVNIWIPYGTYSAKSFRDEFGRSITSRINKISNSTIKVDELKASYESDAVIYRVKFAWETPFDLAKKEVEAVVAGFSGMIPKDITDRIGVWQRNRNSGFFAASLYSSEHNLRELYNIIEPILKPELEKVLDAEMANIWNPERYIISIGLKPEKMAHYGLYPRQIRQSIKQALNSYSGSSVKLGDGHHKFEIESGVKKVDKIKQIPIRLNKKIIYLDELANINFGKDLHRERSFKTNGVSSLILFARPKSGANVKKMSEDILKAVELKKSSLPKSLKMKVIVDPAEAINKSILNLSKDVFVAACMAVVVLLLFIGGVKNVGTAMFEIPLSMILSFIFMKYAGMNLNLISLGGLALAAGMNVDASVVILENIFKKRDIWFKQGKSCETFYERVSLVVEAVREVAFPIILSITTTLIVFIPMAFTSDLTNAILGDLARAVIFSHGISGFVALIVVPTVRVILLKNYKPVTAPMAKPLEKIEDTHEKLITRLIKFRFSKLLGITLPLILMGILVYTLLPKLPKEVIGEPGSDWAYMYVNAQDTKSGRHMENVLQQAESQVLSKLGDKVSYTWLERQTKNSGQILFKLLNRSDMPEVEKKLKEMFPNTPSRYFHIGNWNPSELPLPDENHFEATIKGNISDIKYTASKLSSYLKEKDYYERTRNEPGIKNNFVYLFKPFDHRWSILGQTGGAPLLSDIADISQLTKEPIKVGNLEYNKRSTDIKMSMTDERFYSPEKLSSYPIRINNKIIPLRALGFFESVESNTSFLEEDGQVTARVTAVIKGDEKKVWEEKLASVQNEVRENMDKIVVGKSIIEMNYPQKQLAASLQQLSKSLLFSLLLILFILWMQFQSIKQVLIIMMTIPMGVIGVITSLYVFDSYLSLNSALGVILLNGITVNNSILLTDVYNSLRAKGLRGKDLIITACKKRLRPIIITSLTTVLGMTPVALGLGDGGKILQPLGIAVSCGLLFATAMTVLVVPLLLYRNEESIYLQDENSVQLQTPQEFQSEEQPIL